MVKCGVSGAGEFCDEVPICLTGCLVTSGVMESDGGFLGSRELTGGLVTGGGGGGGGGLESDGVSISGNCKSS